MAQRFVKVAKTSEIFPRMAHMVQVEGLSLAVCSVGGEFYAVENVCTHDGGPLDRGWLDGYQIECPRHGARFDVRSGAPVCVPAKIPIKAYPVRVRGDDIEVELE